MRHTVVAADKKELPCYINQDKSRKDIRTEIACKKLRLLLKTKYSKPSAGGGPREPPFEWKRLDGQVTSDWNRLARFLSVDSDTYSWKWNRPLAASLEIDTAEAEKLFERPTLVQESGAAIDWS